MWRGVRRLVLAFLVVTAVLLAAGAFYQWLSVRAEASRYPPPGALVDIGGRRLHLVCVGESAPGQPTVIFEPGGFSGARSFEKARLEIATQARVCSYDHAGTGWSDPGPSVTSIGTLVDDLERLLRNANVQPPYVLVPSSFGGLTVELFARRHPEQIAGLVFLDAANSHSLNHLAPLVTRTNIEMICAVKWAARFGILRLADPFQFRRQAPASDASRSIAKFYTVERMAALCALARGLPAGMQELNDAPSLASDMPLMVLSAASSEGLLPAGLAVFQAKADALWDDWVAGQQQFARHSTRGTWRLVPASGHLIASSQPHVVARAVLEMLGKLRR
jgi:pimeloyl-ACP methyl ester carboxylesterase